MNCIEITSLRAPEVSKPACRAIPQPGPGELLIRIHAPTMAEAGFPNFETSVWFGLFAPKGTPAPIVANLADAINLSLAEPRTQQRLSELSMDIITSESPEKFNDFFAKDIQRWKDTVIRAKVTVEKN